MSGERELPADPGLPLLTALAEHGAHEVLGRHGLAPAGALRVLGHHAGRRMALGDEDGLIVKAYDRHPVEVVELLRCLEAAGLTGPEPPMATRLLADDPDLAMVVTPRFSGPSGRDLIGADEPERAAALAGAWLRTIATTDVARGPDRGPRFLARQAATWAAELPDGDLRRRASRVVSGLTGAPPPETPRALVHTSFGPRHVIALPGGPGVYDWDGFGQGRIELDVATFLVTTERAAKDRPERVRAARRAQAALLEEVAEIVDPHVLEWHRAVMLVKHAWRMGNARSSRWRERAGALLDAALAAGG